MKYKDYYEVLGVPRDASLEQIKKAYRKLARTNHPDVSKASGGEARFKEAAEAYATLKDPEKRKAYDELGRRPPGEEFAPPPQWQREFGGGSANFGGFGDIDLEELLNSLGRGRGGTRRAARPVPGRDLETTVSISLEDAHRGTTLSLEVGEGEAMRTLHVTIPPGVTQGQKLRLRGKGGKGRNGGDDGDIYLHIGFAPHPVFRPEQHDLSFDLRLAPWEAALGAEVEVPTLDGPVMLTVPAGTRTGRKLRLRGRGMSDGRGGRGDLYAVAMIDIPATLDEREKELFGQLAQASSFNPRAAARSTAQAGAA